jgi:hypothetical protein
MIRHGYTGCAGCHVDPSGAGLLTPYGRAQSELLLATRYGKKGEEPSPRTGFLFGAVELPEWLNLALAFRGGVVVNRAGGTTESRPLLKQSDLQGQVTYGPVELSGSVGYAPRRVRPAALTSREQDNIVSREHWVGLSLLEQALRVRVGRMHLPFGLRNVEHNTWVREATRTDINDQQQHGLSLSYTTGPLRTEWMAIAGNFQLSPSEYRERGYSGYVEWAPRKTLAVGLSSLLTRARVDLLTRQPSFIRQAHGLFGRWAPVPPLVVMVEADALVEKPEGEESSVGYAGLVQGDVELRQGVHLALTGEVLEREESTRVGGWLTAAWFFLPQAELRVDGIARRTSTDSGGTNVFTLLAQLRLTL